MPLEFKIALSGLLFVLAAALLLPREHDKEKSPVVDANAWQIAAR